MPEAVIVAAARSPIGRAVKGSALRRHDKELGPGTMCVGGGQGMVMVIERLGRGNGT